MTWPITRETQPRLALRQVFLLPDLNWSTICCATSYIPFFWRGGFPALGPSTVFAFCGPKRTIVSPVVKHRLTIAPPVAKHCFLGVSYKLPAFEVPTIHGDISTVMVVKLSNRVVDFWVKSSVGPYCSSQAFVNM